MSIRETLAIAVSFALAAPFAAAADPVFSDPTQITNPWAAFREGSVKVFHGKSEGERTAVVETHLAETRVFTWTGGSVECRIVDEQEFADGMLIEVSTHYIAQDDDGNVHYFGEVSWGYEAGVSLGAEEDSWLVGGPTLAGDPPLAYDASGPTMFMPADPVLGTTFQQEDFPGFDETLTVVQVDAKVKVTAGKFDQALVVEETSTAEDEDGPPEKKWIVPGLGIVKSKAKGEYNKLVATSLLEVDEVSVEN